MGFYWTHWKQFCIATLLRNNIKNKPNLGAVFVPGKKFETGNEQCERISTFAHAFYIERYLTRISCQLLTFDFSICKSWFSLNIGFSKLESVSDFFQHISSNSTDRKGLLAGAKWSQGPILPRKVTLFRSVRCYLYFCCNFAQQTTQFNA